MSSLIILGLITVFHFTAIVTDNEFIINTSKCKLPKFQAFSTEANLTYFPQNYTACSEHEPLTYTTVVNNTAFLHKKTENEKLYSSGQEIECFYSYVTRYGSEEEPDVGIRMSSFTYFNTTIPLTGDIVKVECYEDKLSLVYENVHSPITVPIPLKQKLNKFYQENGNTRPLSVLLVVIDSVARLNLERTMPQTRYFLLENGFIEFLGYNKIDDNTFPNFNALLTGLNLGQSYSKCDPFTVGKLDECPMIWYDFRKKGYVTAYAEDWAVLSTYNYLKKGFKDPPTDYYFKPYVEATETLRIIDKDTMPYCTGPETEGERILNLAKDFSVTFKDQPNFGIFWMNTFSHNYINSPSGMDEKVKDFFEEIRDKGILNSSMVILLSDHGMRFGEIRLTIQGWYEERLPVNLISVPEWFKIKYPHKFENLKKNSNKLTSTHDLYMTLQDVLNMSVKHYNVSPSLACPTCSSLFSELPEDRSCSEAGIPEIWCTCLGKFNKSDHGITYKLENKSATLAFKEVIRSELFPINVTVSRILSSSISWQSLNEGYYLTVFETSEFTIHQALFKIKGNPVQGIKLVKVLRLR